MASIVTSTELSLVGIVVIVILVICQEAHARTAASRSRAVGDQGTRQLGREREHQKRRDNFGLRA